jgi:hypothetical protein
MIELIQARADFDEYSLRGVCEGCYFSRAAPRTKAADSLGALTQGRACCSGVRFGRLGGAIE